MGELKSFKEIIKAIEKCGIPGRDLYNLPDSNNTFPDGAHYRMEISNVDTPPQVEAMLDEMRKRDVPVHRIIATGPSATLLTQSDLRDMTQMTAEAKVEMIVIPGIRQDRDTGSHARTVWGSKSGVRPRGCDWLAYLVEDIYRCIEQGIRGFLLYGEDALWLLKQMQKNGDIPPDVFFKLSYTAGPANAASARLLETLGARSINPITDLTLPMLASIRKAIDISLDIVILGDERVGGIDRVWEASEIVRVSSPCYLKQEMRGDCDAVREKVKYCQIMQEVVPRINPHLMHSSQGPEDLCLGMML